MRNFKKGAVFFAIIAMAAWSVGLNALLPAIVKAEEICPALYSGDMVKVRGKPAIYMLNGENKVLYFPSGYVFKTWQAKYGGYKLISQDCYDALPVPSTYPGGVNFRPGVYVVKRASSDQWYVVEPNNTVAKITRSAAYGLYGSVINPIVIDDAHWPNYVNRGPDITTATAHPGMTVRVNGVIYYIDKDNIKRELTADGIKENIIQTKFIKNLTEKAIEGIEKGEEITSRQAELADKAQSGAIDVRVPTPIQAPNLSPAPKIEQTISPISDLIPTPAPEPAQAPQPAPAPTPASSPAPSSAANPAPMILNINKPAGPVRAVFIHHSTGENWLNDANGELGKALRDNNYYLSDTNYGWGPGSIGDKTDIGNWYDWFRGTNSANYLAALYSESGAHSTYSRLASAPAGENQVIIFKSCYPNSALKGNPNDAVPSIANNPLKGMNASSPYMTAANAKGIYIDILEYFKTRQDKLFIAVTAPPVGDATYSANARAFNEWLVNDWLKNYSYNNVFVFDFYNILTTNDGNNNTSDLNLTAGNHHRYWNGAIQHVINGDNDSNANISEYASSGGDDHPTRAGGLKATGEFLPLLNIAYNKWAAAAPAPRPEPVPTQTPAPTPIPEPTSVPTPIPTPIPEQAPVQTPAPESTPTPPASTPQAGISPDDTSVSAGPTYYVSPTGNNSNAGTREKPWATIAHGARRMQGGGTLIILGGRYNISKFGDCSAGDDGDAICPPSGTAASWTIIKGEDGNRPVIAGGGNLYAAFFLNGRSYVKIENIEITNNNGANFREGIDADYTLAEHIILKDLYVHHIDETGVKMRDVNDLKILNSKFLYCGAGAIGGSAALNGGWRNILIKNSELSYSGRYYQNKNDDPAAANDTIDKPYSRPDGFGIEPSAGPIEIAYSKVEYNRGDGIDSKAANTFIHHSIIRNNRGDGVKMWGDNSKLENSLVAGFSLEDNGTPSGFWSGITIDEVSTANARFEINNVTVYDSSSRNNYSMYVQFQQSTPVSVKMTNTIIANGGGAVYFGDAVTAVLENNLFYRPAGGAQVYANRREYTAAQMSQLGAGNISADPKLVSPSRADGADFHAQSASPAVNAGKNNGLSDDLSGAARPQGAGYDMGAYEK